MNKFRKLTKLDLFIGVLVFLASVMISKAIRTSLYSNDPRSSSVKITNRAKTSGGTGIILQSSSSKSVILTNDHVCKLIKKNGGLVLTDNSEYQAVSIMESEVSDLCLVKVSDDLGVNTNISTTPPKMYETETVSGHPALLPNVLSYGHFSGRSIVQVMTEIRPCTDEQQQDEKTGLICTILNGLPVVKSYESVLVTSTIMPGSSGSGVYNSKNELTGVVFAGSEGFGYAWTVPYEQMIEFLYSEIKHLKKQNLSQELDLFGSNDQKQTKEVLNRCMTATNDEIIKYCSLMKRDMVYHE